MAQTTSRRFVLAGLLAGAATGAAAGAPLTSHRPMPRPGAGEGGPEDLATVVQGARFGGEIGFVVADAGTGEVVEAFNPDLRLPPASVTKTATAFYALSTLGAGYRFRTRLVATGAISGGRLDGDLILRGGGDPLLDTDALAGMAVALREMGLREVRGRFRVDASALPEVPHIDPDQPDYVGYNPTISGLNLNFNRVHFEWKRAAGTYEVTMQARGERFSPGVETSRIAIEDRRLPVYTYDGTGGIDRWTVARAALGNGGARWLPVRRPADYAAETFRTLARSNGIVLERGPDAAGVGGETLLVHESPPLSDVLRGMLYHSTNLTAEVVGLAATRESGEAPHSLIRSARRMNRWLNGPVGARSTGFVDHSGLGYGSRVSARDMVHLLATARHGGLVPRLMKPWPTDVPGASVVVKTGTLNFVSALAGFVEVPGARTLVFAIFTADRPRRDAVPVAQRERPDGARAWANASRGFQQDLVERWAGLVRA